MVKAGYEFWGLPSSVMFLQDNQSAATLASTLFYIFTLKFAYYSFRLWVWHNSQMILNIF